MVARVSSGLALALALVLCGTGARADDAAPILGKWAISRYVIAPWARPEDSAMLNTEAKKLLKLQVTYTAKSVVAKHPTIGCKDAHYETSSFPYEDLFQGELGEVPADARAKTVKEVGFPLPPVPGIELGCSTGDFSYHFRDPNTVVFALNDVIYVLTRQ